MIFGKSSILSRRKQIWQHRLTPRLETLEDRRLLATLTVDTAGDVVDGDVSSIAALLDARGNNGFISLREAILATNATDGADEIAFDNSLSGSTIHLVLGEYEILDNLTITGMGASQTIIDAGGQSRIFNVTAADGEFSFNRDFFISGMSLIDGRTTGYREHGGTIRSDSVGQLTITDSTISGSSTAGENANGGGVFSNSNISLFNSIISGNAADDGRGGGIYAQWDVVSLTNSTVSGNSTAGHDGHGGGIYARFGSVDLTRSTISGNSTAGMNAYGGGIRVNRNFIRLTDSTISGNSTEAIRAFGGGISVARGAILNRSTISGNSTAGFMSRGGGIQASYVYLTSSTVSGNSTKGDRSSGGGISVFRNVSLTGSTISGNSTQGSDSSGGGIDADEVTMENSIVAGNTVAPESLGPDLFISGSISVDHSLIGDNQDTALSETQGFDPDGNLIGSSNGIGKYDPMLAPLNRNGGPTSTHALLPGSPAIDSGSNPDGLEFDQRGEPFVRVFGNAPDMGAVELQPSHVMGLFVNSTLWNEAFRENLGEFGFSLIGETAGPLPLSWSHLDQISITVVGDASEISPTDLGLFGVVHGTHALDAGLFQYDSDSRTATWVLDSALHPNGIEADSLTTVLDDFTFSFDILPGDGNRNGIVDIRDVQALRAAHLANIGDQEYQPELDFDGSGLIDLRDLQILRENLLNKLPKQLPRPVLASLPHLEDTEPLAVTRRNSRRDQIFATLTDDYVFDKSDLFGHE